MSEENKKVNYWPAIILLLFVALISYNLGYKAALIFTPCPEQTYIKGKDSIVHDTAYIERAVNNPKPTKTYAAAKLTNIDRTNSAQNPCDDSIRVYVNNYVDSSGSIQVTDSVQGKLLSQRMSSAIIQTTVYRTDTIVLTKEIIKQGIIFGPYASMNIGEKTSISAGLIYAKNRTGYMAGYNPITKNMQVGIFYDLSKKH